VVDLKKSASAPPLEDLVVEVQRPGQVGADPFSCGGVVGLAAAAAVAGGGSVCVDDWSLDVDVPPAARRRRLRRSGNFEGFEFDGERLTETQCSKAQSQSTSLKGGVFNV